MGNKEDIDLDGYNNKILYTLTIPLVAFFFVLLALALASAFYTDVLVFGSMTITGPVIENVNISFAASFPNGTAAAYNNSESGHIISNEKANAIVAAIQAIIAAESVEGLELPSPPEPAEEEEETTETTSEEEDGGDGGGGSPSPPEANDAIENVDGINPA